MQLHVTPYLCAKGAAEAIEFYKNAFGAEETYRYEEDGKIGHLEMLIGETTLYLSDEWEPMGVLSPLTLKGNSVSLSISTDDAEAVFKRATDAGARVERPLGHRWNIRTPKEGA
jgi:PhnB protein